MAGLIARCALPGPAQPQTVAEPTSSPYCLPRHLGGVIRLLAAALLLAVVLTVPATAATTPLHVSANMRYLVDTNDTPFFWLGDTAWRFLTKLGRADYQVYFADRASRGFTVIHTFVSVDTTNNFYGDPPFNTFGDLRSHNENYFANVAYFLAAAESNGLHVLLVPLFFPKPVNTNWISNAAEIYDYGKWLGARYKTNANIIWGLGGDVNGNSPNNNYTNLWKEMARGIAAGVNDGMNPDYTKCLMTYHPIGYSSSSTWFHGDAWLDFNGFQTYDSPKRINPMATADYARTPPKPTVLLEPEYEYDDQPAWMYTTPAFNRRQAYWAFLSGTAGYTYGCGPIFRAQPAWQAALNWPGAAHMIQFKSIVSSNDWWRFAPDQTIVTNGVSNNDLLITAGKSSSGGRFLVYVPVLPNPSNTVVPRNITVDMAKVTAASVCLAKWIYPANGAPVILGTFPNSGTRTFTTPAGWEDALLVVEAITQPPVFTRMTLANGAAIFNGTGGPANGTYYVLGSTNLALPRDNWSRHATNLFDATGNFSFTTVASSVPRQCFYMLQLP